MHSTSSRPVGQRPVALPVDPAGIPGELKSLPQWILWRYTWVPDKQKWDKPPRTIEGGPASSTDPDTWTTFDETWRAYQAGGWNGIGFVPTADDPFVLLDLDHVVGPEGIGTWSSELRKRFAGDVPEPGVLVARLDTYTELTPSGTGLRPICRGILPKGRRKIGGKGNGCPDGLEMYEADHYLTITGARLPGAPSTIGECNGELSVLHAAVFGAAKQAPETQTEITARAQTLDPALDSELIERAKQAADGPKFCRLWSGETTGYPSESEADLALASILAFWCRGNYAQIERLMRQSGLKRPKWDTHKTYLWRTITKAVEDTTRHYGDDTAAAALGSSGQGQATSTKASNTPRKKSPTATGLGLTDIGNAERFAQAHGHDLRFCWPWNKWLCWDGRRWFMDDIGEILHRAKSVVQDMYAAVATLADAASRGALAKHALDSARAARIRAMIELARAEEGIPIWPAAFDTDPWVLNCLNGTLDLRTGDLRPHKREDYLTKLCPVAYDPGAGCPVWLSFLERIVPDANLRSFLRRAVGMSLTGDVREHVLFFLYGTGSNGKSTFLNQVHKVLGDDYAMKAPPELLMVKKGESHPTERADLAGKRFVACVEAGEGRRLAEALAKELTGSDPIRARRMREDFWQFDPTHKIWLAANHKPVIRGTDWGIWRRIKLIPLVVRIPDEEQDKDLSDKLRAESSGILNWAVLGCLEWQKDGLGEPEAVRKATAEYRSEMDILGAFIADCCDEGPALEVPAADIYQRYKAWAEAGHEYVMTQTAFGTALGDRDYVRGTITAGRHDGCLATRKLHKKTCILPSLGLPILP